jgi:hypothetical protein
MKFSQEALKIDSEDRACSLSDRKYLLYKYTRSPYLPLESSKKLPFHSSKEEFNIVFQPFVSTNINGPRFFSIAFVILPGKLVTMVFYELENSLAAFSVFF